MKMGSAHQLPKKVCLVTGATGMIGRSLVMRLVEEGWRVNALTRGTCQSAGDPFPPSVRIIKGNLEDKISLEKATQGVEAVFHAGAKVHATPRTREEEDEFFQINAVGTSNLLQTCGQAPLRTFVFLSTIGVYGSNSEGPMRETSACHPEGAYAASKYQAEREILNFFARKNVPAMILRLAMVYGEAERGNFLRLVKSIEKGRFIYFGNADCRKSMTYVGNVVDAVILASTKQLEKSEVFNLADPSPYPLKLVVETIARELGVCVSPKHIPARLVRFCGSALESLGNVFRFQPPFTPADVTKLTCDTICDVSKIKSLLGFEPHMALEEGVRRTVQWYRRSKTSFAVS